jgi:hypothetical protein
MVLDGLVKYIIEQNPEFAYLKDKPVYFFPLSCGRVFGGYVLPLDRIVLFGEPDEPTLIFSISRELEHMHYRHQHGILKTMYKLTFNRREMERRATRKGISILEKIGKRSYLEWMKEMIKNYRHSDNPLERLICWLNYR